MKAGLITILIFLEISLKAISQPYVDLLNSKYIYYPSTEYNPADGQKVSSKQWTTSLLLPLELKNKDLILVGADYSEINFEITGKSNYKSSLQSTDIFLGYNKQWKNEKWKTLFLFIPKINRQISNATSRDYQWGGLVLFDYKKKVGLRYHFGLYYNREYFGDFFIPLLGIDWKVNDRYYLFGDLPNSLTLEKKLNKKIYAGASFSSIIASYRPDLSYFSGSFVREGDKFWGHNELKLFINFYLASHIVVYLEAGRTFGRNYQLYSGEALINFTNDVYRKTNDSFLLNGGLAYRFRLDEK